ncbi:MAG TPA: PSD1 and planctomycete cytochrome C domain-containing protein [Verrucomicrobiae bacterium]|nr:PSD1 and planctomycete cytochrome C domain-containing protein [Verrucomicrobiae bacterium]
MSYGSRLESRQALQCSDQRQSELPLTGGEGRGEGERHNQLLPTQSSLLITVCLALIGFLAPRASLAIEPTAERIEFFEAKIRPLFADNCYPCHSAKQKIKGDLRLDVPAKILTGGHSGPAIVPGDADASLLIKAVRYADEDLQMPPDDKKLTAEQIALLENWVKMGAPMPQTSDAPKLMTEVSEARAKHWAFQPVKKPTPPKVKTSSWVRTPVDNFVLAKLEEKKLKPSPQADRRTLIRRLSYDLVGLPPTPEEVRAFEKDKSPDAYPKLVDRLLASAHYGERWGRHWLDVARYADTKGYLAGGEERRYKFSYTYRDYVIRSFNEDKPYDQFLIEQIAADFLATGDDKSSLAAMGFLTLGRRFLNNRNDIIDDRIDVITRGTMGLTVTCARCHDHKFDPISAKDYYALHGIFDSSEEPGELPLLKPLTDSEQYQDYLKEVAKIEKEIARFEEKEIEEFRSNLRKNVGDYLVAANAASKLEDQSKFDDLAGNLKVLPVILRRWMTDLNERQKQTDSVLGPWFECVKFSETNFAAEVKPLLDRLASDSPGANALVAKAIVEKKPESLKQVADVYEKLFRDIDAEWTDARKKKEKQTLPTSLADTNRESIRLVLYAEGAPTNLPDSEVRKIHARRLGEVAAPLRNKIDALSWTHPGVPLRAMAMVDRSNPHDSPVFIRGNPQNKGEKVPRRFLEVLSAETPAPFTNGSGRLELARAITSPDNPLTARVYVNRVWLHHFGAGLVSTPGDFGVRTESPVHRELLDYLAATFLEKGWSTKQLHRMIVLSATYQQSSDASPKNLAADPENDYWHHMNRRRLDFESLRDTLLAISGTLDLQVGGLPVDLGADPAPTRRTVYALIDRQNLPGVFRTFDFANPDVSNQGRFYTTVPQQALALMNSPFVIEQVRKLVQREEIARAKSDKDKIDSLHQLVWQRPAQSFEVRQAEQFLALQSADKTTLTPLEKYAQVLLLSNELMFVD